MAYVNIPLPHSEACSHEGGYYVALPGHHVGEIFKVVLVPVLPIELFCHLLREAGLIAERNSESSLLHLAKNRLCGT